MAVTTALIWRGAGFSNGARIDGLLARWLTDRGIDVRVTHCDAALDGCTFRTVQDHADLDRWPHACAACQATNRELAIPDGAAEIRISELAQAASPAVPVHHDDELHAVASTIRYLQAEPSLDGADQDLLDRYRHSATISRAAAERIAEDPPDLVLMSHGIYVDWGPPFDVLREAGARVVRWGFGYLPAAIFMRENFGANPHHMYYLPDDAWDRIASTPLTERQNRNLDQRLAAIATEHRKKQRRHVEGTSLVRHPSAIAAQLGLDLRRPTWCIFPHLNWDAHMSFEGHLYESASEWLIATARAAAKDPSVQWLIKCHPAEHRLGTAHGSEAILRQHLGEVPGNVTVIPADSNIDTYGLLDFVSGVVTQRGTVAMEAAVRGLPSILGGEAHYGAKGFTNEPASEAAYEQAIATAGGITRLDDEEIKLARRYAHDFFVRRQLRITNRLLNGKGLNTGESGVARRLDNELRRILLGER